MKKLLLIVITMLANLSFANAQKDQLYQLFDKFQETEGVTSIKIAKPMFGILNSLDIKDAELQQLKPMLDKIQGMRILIIDNTKDQQNPETTQGKLSEAIAKSIGSLNYEELMSVNSKGNKIKFLSGNAKDGILDNLLLDVNAEGSTVLMLLDGKISMDDINNLVSEHTSSQNKTTTQVTIKESALLEEIRNLGKFSSIEVSQGINVVFTQGKPQRVKVMAEQDKLQYIKTEIVDGVLKIYINTDGKKRMNFQRMDVEITASDLQKITAKSGAKFTTVNTLNVDSFDVVASSGASVSANIKAKSNVNLYSASGASTRLDVAAKSLNTDAKSGTSVNLTGKVADTKFNATSGASVNAQNLISKTSEIKVSSAANLKVNVSDLLNASLGSGAVLRHKGTPKKINTVVGKNSGAVVKSF